MSELVAGIIGAAVGGFVTFCGEIVRDGIRARRQARLERDNATSAVLSEVIEDLRELQGAVFSGVPRSKRKDNRP